MTVLKTSQTDEYGEYSKMISYDDTAIQRITYGSMMKSSFSKQQQSHQTGPRRPDNNKYFIGSKTFNDSSETTQKLSNLTLSVNSPTSQTDISISSSSSGKTNSIYSKMTNTSVCLKSSHASTSSIGNNNTYKSQRYVHSLSSIFEPPASPPPIENMSASSTSSSKSIYCR